MPECQVCGYSCVINLLISNITSHFSLEFSMNVYLFGRWKNDKYYVILDNNDLLVDKYNCNNLYNNCDILLISIITLHSSDNMNFSIINSIQSSSQYIGIANLNIWAHTCDNACKSCVNENYCLTCDDNANLISGSCICNEGYYMMDSSYMCLSCLSECKTCENASTCTSCYDNAHLDNASYCACDPGYIRNGFICEQVEIENFEVISYNGEISDNYNCNRSFINPANGSNIIDFYLGIIPSYYSISFQFMIYGDTTSNLTNMSFSVSINNNYILTQIISFVTSEAAANDTNLCDAGLLISKTTNFSSTTYNSPIDFQITLSNVISNNRWFIDSLNVTAFLCNETCKTCSGGSSNQCTSCFDNAILETDNSCQCNKIEGFYMDIYRKKGSVCKRCDKGCIQCDKMGCLICDTNYININNSCAANNSVNIINDTQESIDWMYIDSNQSLQYYMDLSDDIPGHYSVYISLSLLIDKSIQLNEIFINDLLINDRIFDYDPFLYMETNYNAYNIRGSINDNKKIFSIGLLFNGSGDISNRTLLKMYNFSIDLLICGSACKECYGSSNSACIACYPFAYKTIDNECICNDGFTVADSSDCYFQTPNVLCSLCKPTQQLQYNLSNDTGLYLLIL